VSIGIDDSEMLIMGYRQAGSWIEAFSRVISTIRRYARFPT
jgi:hypothetical protein